jgi:hypothetical protein
VVGGVGDRIGNGLDIGVGSRNGNGNGNGIAVGNRDATGTNTCTAINQRPAQRAARHGPVGGLTVLRALPVGRRRDHGDRCRHHRRVTRNRRRRGSWQRAGRC